MTPQITIFIALAFVVLCCYITATVVSANEHRKLRRYQESVRQERQVTNDITEQLKAKVSHLTTENMHLRQRPFKKEDKVTPIQDYPKAHTPAPSILSSTKARAKSTTLRVANQTSDSRFSMEPLILPVPSYEPTPSRHECSTPSNDSWSPSDSGSTDSGSSPSSCD